MVGLVALEPTHLFLWNVEYHPQRTIEAFHEMRTHTLPIDTPHASSLTFFVHEVTPE